MQPAELLDELRAGAEVQVVGVAEDDLRAELLELARSTALTVARVPTGMKTGVSMTPCAVVRRPARALPSVVSSVKSPGATYVDASARSTSARRSRSPSEIQ